MTAIMGVALLVLLVQDVPLSFYLRTVESARIVTALERDAFVLGGRSEEALESGRPGDTGVITALAQTYRDAGGARVVIVDADGSAIVTSDDDQAAVGASYLSRPEIARALSGEVTSGERFSDTLGVELLYVAVPVFSGERVVGVVRLTYPKQVVTDSVTARLQVLGLIALTTVLLAGIVGLVLSYTVTRPLRLLHRTTELLAHGELRTRADETAGAPELRSLSRSFNTMADRLEGLIAGQRAFAADASHQLRTPLTALRLKIERARELVAHDPAAAASRLAAAEEETDRLAAIIEGLLLLSRGEARDVESRDMDLAAIARERVDQWRPLAQETGVSLDYEGPASCVVGAAETAVEQIIDNFLDNALAVSGRGAGVIVRVVAGAAPEVHVVDDGPGLTDDQRARAFDRFWQASHTGGGSGLGLAIVAQLAQASGGSVRLDASDGGGVDAVATFRPGGIPNGGFRP